MLQIVFFFIFVRNVVLGIDCIWTGVVGWGNCFGWMSCWTVATDKLIGTVFGEMIIVFLTASTTPEWYWWWSSGRFFTIALFVNEGSVLKKTVGLCAVRLWSCNLVFFVFIWRPMDMIYPLIASSISASATVSSGSTSLI